MTFLHRCRDQGLVSEPAFLKLSIFAELIERWNARINLTGLRARDDIETILLGEPLLALRHLSLAWLSVLDFGSGAGIPGLVWAICEPAARVTSVEIRQKKVAFQKEVLRTTGTEAEIICGKFPDAVAGRAFNVVSTRAVRFSPSLWKVAEDVALPGGVLVRFGKAGDRVVGWENAALSGRSSLLLRKKPA